MCELVARIRAACGGKLRRHSAAVLERLSSEEATGEMTSSYTNLAGQVALITGGAGAIGRAIGTGLLSAGARVALVDTAEQRLQKIAAELGTEAGPTQVLALVADVTNSQQVRQAFDRTLERFGRLDILVNNAATTQIKAVDALADADIDLIVDTNLKGYIKCAREAARIMKGNGIQGSMLFVSSKNGLLGAANKSLYCATKGGELALARALALELGEFGIRVNSICPDAVLEGSALWEDDSYRLGTAERYHISESEIPEYYRQRCALKTNIEPVDVANAALFLLSGTAAKITGAILSVDGGVAFVR
jgi:NAD(P)-dependent dehydrogenase (short-subunit alcohol dehydrogenase family)